MKAKTYFFSFVFFLIALFGIGCGVPQEEYDKAKSELAAAQEQVESLESELKAARSQIEALQGDYEKAAGELKAARDRLKSLQKDYDKVSNELKAVQSQIETLQGDYDQVKEELKATQAQIRTLQQKMKRAKAEAEILGGILIPAITGELDQMTELEAANWFLGWIDRIQAAEDPVAEEKFQALIASGFREEEMMDFFLYLLENIPKMLEQ